MLLFIHLFSAAPVENAYYTSASGLENLHSRQGNINNAVYAPTFEFSPDHFEILWNVSNGFSRGHWILPAPIGEISSTRLRLDSKLYLVSSNGSSLLSIEELYAIKGKARRKQFGAWMKESGLTVEAGRYLERRSNLSDVT